MKKRLLIILCFLLATSFVVAQTKNTINKSATEDTLKIEIIIDTLTYHSNNKPDLTVDTLELIQDGGFTSKGSLTNINAVSNYAARPLPSNLDAGRTSGVIDISATGSATYTIPIAVPPGINGVMPQLALTYASQGGNGLAGYGWNVSGLSSITRIPATKFHDGFIGGVNFNMNDRFALDGQRLILKSGVYGTDGAEYQTEAYSNLKIISRGVANHLSNTVLGPAYFEVQYPDGSKAFYGFNYTSSLDPRNYAISYSENPQGLKIFYEYIADNNTIYISEIKYGGPTFPLSINTIRFLYKNRQRTEQVFIGDLNFFTDKILYEINVIGANNTGYRNYVLAHNTIAPFKYERLVSIQEFSGDKSRAFEPIIFNYETTNNLAVQRNVSQLDVSGYSATNTEVLTSDFTGDGKLDFITYPKEVWNRNQIRLYYGDEIGPNSYGGISLPQFSVPITTGTFNDIFPVTWLTHSSKVMPGQGIVIVKTTSNSSIDFKVLSTSLSMPLIHQYTKVWQNVPTTPSYYSDCNQATIPGNTIEKKFLSGDFNGDGLTDIIAVNKPYYVIDGDYFSYCDDGNGGYENCCIDLGHTEYVSKVNFINLDRRLNASFINEAGTLIQYFTDNDKLTTGDFDGDGKTDIFHIASGKIFIYTLNQQNNLQLLCQQSDSRINLTYQPLFGDFNGDGKTDFLIPTGTSTNLFASFISTGKKFKKEESNMPFDGSSVVWNGQTATMTANNIVANDVDGDGKTDIIKYFSTTKNGQNTGTFVVRVYSNMGSATRFDPPSFLTGPTFAKTINLIHYPIPVFLTSDKPNLSLEFGVLSDNSVSLFGFTKDFKKETLLNSIVQDGVTHILEYKDLNPNANGINAEIPLYQSAFSQTYPFIDIALAPGLKVVSKLKRVFEASTLQQIFGYRNAVSNSEGLGFMGFGQFIKSNWHVNLSDANKIFSITVSNPQLRGAATKSFNSKNSYISDAIIVDQTLGTLNDFINRTDNTYTTELLPNKVYKSTVSNVNSRDLISNTTTTIAYQYDAYNNLTKETSNFSGAGTKTTDITYANNPTGTPFYTGRPLTKITTLSNGADVFSTEEQYSYTGFLLTKIKKKGNNTTFMTDSMQYDAFGNVLQKITIAPTNAQRLIKMAYDPTGRFLIKETDVEGLETNYEFNAVNGNLIKKTNPYGLTNLFGYNVWGRLGYSTDELGKFNSKVLNKWGSNMEIEEWTDAGFEKRTLVNAIGQKLQEKVMDVFGVWKYKAWQYDVYDRLVKESETSLDSTAYTQWNQTAYDNYGRINQITTYTGKVTIISYNGLNTTVNDGTKSVITNKDALGNVTSTQDPGGTINNTYFANGNLKTADYGGSVQSIEQDGWGRKTKLTDPSAGVYIYHYTPFGETWQEVTPKGRTTYLYDANGKVNLKRVRGLVGDPTDNTHVYVYDNVTKLLNSVTFRNNRNVGNNSTNTYTYDDFKRITTAVEDNTFATFTKTFTYDEYGRIATEASTALSKAHNKTATKTIRNNYQNGSLKSITDLANNTNIWEVAVINARGQVTEANLGTLQKQTNFYDSFGLPKEIKINRFGATPALLMKLTYSFNALRGNLTSRTSSLFTTNETFTYDNLDRLTEINTNGQIQTQVYDNRGRITSNNTWGSYVYTNPNSYQQASLTSLTATALAHYQNNTPQQITYNAFKKPLEIYQQGKDRISFLYNAAQERSTIFYGDEQTDPTQRRYRRHYSEDGSMEITNDREWGLTSFVFYLAGDAYTSPAIWKEVHHNMSGNKNANLYYLHRDYQGTILQITNTNGTIQENRQFDAWGNIVKITDGTGTILTTFAITDRGYTGHEHLISVGIINMNGRLYDPLLHRFLSPDNYVQDPTNTQNFNRYGYVMNNPLKYTDESGEFFFTAILGPVGVFIDAACWGAVIGGAGYVASVALSPGGFNNWNWGSFGKAVGMGALSGVLTAGIGEAFGAVGKFGHELLRAGAHGFSGGFTNLAFGGDFMQGFASGALGSLAGSGFQELGGNFAKSAAGTIGFSAVAGGVGAELTGGEFWKGATTGAIVAGLNHVAHIAGDGDGSRKPSSKVSKDSPPTDSGYEPPKSGDRKVRNPNGSGSGWVDKKGRVWVPQTHKGTHAPHWDVQNPKGGGYITVYPSVSTSLNIGLGVASGLLIWEGLKWGGAILLAPETGGASLGLLALP